MVARRVVRARRTRTKWFPRRSAPGSSNGLPRIRLHDVRHSHTTHLLDAGTNVRVTSEHLGHASVAFNLDVYDHALPGQQADAGAAAFVDG